VNELNITGLNPQLTGSLRLPEQSSINNGDKEIPCCLSFDSHKSIYDDVVAMEHLFNLNEDLFISQQINEAGCLLTIVRRNFQF